MVGRGVVLPCVLLVRNRKNHACRRIVASASTTSAPPFALRVTRSRLRWREVPRLRCCRVCCVSQGGPAGARLPGQRPSARDACEGASLRPSPLLRLRRRAAAGSRRSVAVLTAGAPLFVTRIRPSAVFPAQVYRAGLQTSLLIVACFSFYFLFRALLVRASPRSPACSRAPSSRHARDAPGSDRQRCKVMCFHQCRRLSVRLSAYTERTCPSSSASASRPRSPSSRVRNTPSALLCNLSSNWKSLGTAQHQRARLACCSPQP